MRHILALLFLASCVTSGQHKIVNLDHSEGEKLWACYKHEDEFHCLSMKSLFKYIKDEQEQREADPITDM